jgi:hypothetical protein
MLAKISQLPYMEENDQGNLLDYLTRAATNPSDILKEDSSSDLKELEKALND